MLIIFQMDCFGAFSNPVSGIMQDGFDERYIVQRVLAGDQEAFVQLIHQYERLVLHVVTPLIGVNQDREDICQDIFIKVYVNLGAFRFKSKLGTWIGNIAYNTSLNFLKKKKHISMSSLTASGEEIMGNLIVESNNAEKMMIKKEDITDLVRSIDKLTNIQRTVILLFYQDEMSLDEISETLSIPVNTVKSHLFRARAELKKLMEQTR